MEKALNSLDVENLNEHLYEYEMLIQIGNAVSLWWRLFISVAFCRCFHQQMNVYLILSAFSEWQCKGNECEQESASMLKWYGFCFNSL